MQLLHGFHIGRLSREGRRLFTLLLLQRTPRVSLHPTPPSREEASSTPSSRRSTDATPLRSRFAGTPKRRHRAARYRSLRIRQRAAADLKPAPHDKCGNRGPLPGDAWWVRGSSVVSRDAWALILHGCPVGDRPSCCTLTQKPADSIPETLGVEA